MLSSIEKTGLFILCCSGFKATLHTVNGILSNIHICNHIETLQSMVWLLTKYTLATAGIMEITQQFLNPRLFLKVSSSFNFQHKKEQHFYVAKGKLQFDFFKKGNIV